MDLYRTKTLLWRAAALLGVALAASAAGIVLWPMDVASGQGSGASATTARADRDPDPDRPLDHYAVIWQRPLRRPLYDPKPVVEVKAKAPEPRLAIRLRGTVIEEGFSYAILTDAKGKVVLARVGRTVGGAEVKSISDGSVQVLFAGKLRTLTIQKPKSRR